MFELSEGGSARRRGDGGRDVFVATGFEAAAEAANAAAAATEPAASKLLLHVPGRISRSNVGQLSFRRLRRYRQVTVKL